MIPGGDEGGRLQESNRTLMVAMVAGMGEGQDGWIGLNPAGEGETLRRGDQGEAKGQDRQGQARTGKDRQGQARTGKDRQGQAREREAE
jgi:hypothetical protein